VVAVFAREPAPGFAKTRLIPALGAEGAASLYGALLQDRCEALRSAGLSVVVAHTPDDAGPRLAAQLPAGLKFFPQGGGGLSERLISVSAALFEAGASAVVMMDSDSPTLPISHLHQTLDRLAGGHADCVLGPAEDGGYVLIGLSRAQPQLFDGIPWSSPQVLEATRARAEAAGLRVELLEPWWDVDTPEDLARLRGQLLDARWPRHTAEWLRRERLSRRGEPRPVAEDASEQPWLRQDGRLVYANNWMQVREDTVLLPDGRHSPYGVVTTGRCVGVLPFLDQETVVMVRQHRYIAGRSTWEMPTGGVHPAEELVAAAQRELAEEAGYVAGELLLLGAPFHTNKSIMDETAQLFMGLELQPAVGQQDDTEFIRVEAVPFRQVVRWVEEGEITDAMTIMAVLRAQLLRRSEE